MQSNYRENKHSFHIKALYFIFFYKKQKGMMKCEGPFFYIKAGQTEPSEGACVLYKEIRTDDFSCVISLGRNCLRLHPGAVRGRADDEKP